MKRVTFVRSHRMYNAGETAGFLPQQADDLIASGFAVDADHAEKQAKAMARAEVRAAAKAASDLLHAAEIEARAQASAEVLAEAGALAVAAGVQE